MSSVDDIKRGYKQIEGRVVALQGRLDNLIRDTPDDELEALLGELTEISRLPELTIDYRSLIGRIEQNKVKDKGNHHLNLFRLYLSGDYGEGGEVFGYKSESPLDKRTEFVLEHHDARLWVTVGEDHLHVWPQWTRDGKRFCRIDSREPHESLVYLIRFDNFDDDLSEMREELHGIFEHLRDYVRENKGKPDFRPRLFATGQYYVGRSGS